jgi:hypothetical protein
VPALVGPASFAAAAIVGARKVPGYRHRDEPMSALAARGTASSPIMVSGFLALAASTWALASTLEDSRVPRPIRRWLQVTGAGIALAGLARQSDRSCPVRFLGDDHVTVSDDLHVLFSGVVFGSWIAMPFVASGFGQGLRPVDRRRSFAAGLVALSGWGWMSTLMQRDVEKWGGVAQRVTVAGALAWYPVIALAAGHQR